jgi:hypothetical protein
VVKTAARFRVHALRSAEVDLDEVFHDYYRTEGADAASGAKAGDAGSVVAVSTGAKNAPAKADDAEAADAS